MELRLRYIILAAVVAFVAWGYLTDALPQLLYLPWAFLAGILCTLGGLGWIILTTSKPLKDREKSARAQRSDNVLLFSQPQVWTTECQRLKRRLDYRTFPVYPESKEVSHGADALLELVIRDFVSSWYSTISKRTYFQNEVDRAVRTALCSILNRVLELDIIDLVVSRFTPIVTKHLHDFDEAEHAVRGKKLSRNMTDSDEMNEAIAAKYCGGRLHLAASLAYSDTRLAEQTHLRGIVMRLLPRILPASMTKSAAVNVLIKEILSCAVLFPVVSMLIDPDFWNQQMEAYGKSIVEERKTVRRLRAALDEHAPSSPQSTIATPIPRLAPGDNERRFERFFRAVNKCNNLSDARRFRSEIAAQLRKGSEVEEPDQVYLRRLEKGKRALDQKIATMATSGSTGSSKTLGLVNSTASTTATLENASLREVLYNSSGLSSFMEYMDRQNVMQLVQFWIIVDGVRNPLDIETDTSVDYVMAWTDSDRADIAQINEAYLTLPEINASAETQENVSHFLRAGRSATSKDYLAARRAVLQTQTKVYEEMAQYHYPNFKKSDLYYKWLASGDAVPTATMAANPSSGHPPSAEAVNFESASPKLTRPSKPLPRLSHNNTVKREHDLRRAVVSSSDVKNFISSSRSDSPQRRSFENAEQRAPLFDDDDGDDSLAHSTQSLDALQEPQRSLDHEQRVVDAMQAALTDIMDQPNADLFVDVETHSPHDPDHMTRSFEIERTASPALDNKGNKLRPSLASLGLVGAQSTSRFLDDHLFGDEQKFVEDEREDSEGNEKSEEDQIHEAAPGDLGLAEAIDALTGEIEKLVTQESIVDSLTNKAELTNNAAELRILRKSKASLQREINRKELQRQQYIVQESDNSLYGRATISIQSIMVGQAEDGKEFATYVIEVQRQAGEQMPAATWVVARRYSEFHELNKRLRAKHPAVRKMDFPRRQVVLKLQKDFLQKRKLGLEHYLRDLLRIPAICRSIELRAFLSQQAIMPVKRDGKDTEVDTRDFVTRIYNSVTDGMEEFLGNIPVLDQLSLAGQNLISAAAVQLTNAPASLTSSPHSSSPNNGGPHSGSGNGGVGSGNNNYQQAAEAEAELRAFESRELEPFVKPICDLFLEAFELNRESNWLRGRAVVVVLHQLLGSTVERRARDLGRTHLSDEAVAQYLVTMKEMLWPGGRMKAPATARTAADKTRSRKEAGLALATLVPELVGSVVGRTNASSASRRFLAVFNNRRLNTHLVYTTLDELIKVVFNDKR